jgi:hypothetical protein
MTSFFFLFITLMYATITSSSIMTARCFFFLFFPDLPSKCVWGGGEHLGQQTHAAV